MSQFNFEYPWVFALILVFVVCAKFCKVKGRSIYFPHLESLLVSSRRSSLIVILKWLGIITAIIALASPVITKEYSNSKRDGRDIVLIIDASESMRQARFDVNNMRKNKFEVVKEVASDFVSKRTQDRIGLVTFADIAFIASPLTFEKKFLQDIIAMQRLGVAGKRTAINDSLAQTYNMLSNSKAKSKIAILLTDGIDNMSRVPLADIKSLIEKSPVKLYTIGIGTNQDYDGRYLKELADAGKGQAYGARNAEMLSQIYAKIDELEASKIEDKKFVKHTYLYIFPLFISIISLLLFIYFKNMRGKSD
ncbi:VWA domain-containing protein [Sulfurovum sp. bin170]|uniref:vWA domain-containing protein n=1 Tax=Sulfurovum sp. bin170 TaxID=2695268 RepID=UPI0013E04B89|nr:VWA domain-containing protein [Sulfurovum sp. bin170]NEW60718.1 VWA domain-containing protein [Sulfurovum sp. bin170]